MTSYEVDGLYFDWLCGLVFPAESTPSYCLVCRHLFLRDFYSDIPMDRNRACDGIALRTRFANETGAITVDQIGLHFSKPCRVLEMMIALALRMDHDIVWDPEEGSQASRWFKEMLESMDLDTMFDEKYDFWYVDAKIDNLLDREYEASGHGGLFTVPDTDVDFRTLEIWYQMLRYLNTVI